MPDGISKSDELTGLSIASPERSNGHHAERVAQVSQYRNLSRLRLLWFHRRIVVRATLWGALASLAIAFIIPKRFESTTRLMPPEQAGTSSGMALLAAAATGAAGSALNPSMLAPGLGSTAGDLLGLKSSGALFVGILRSQTVEDDIIRKFDLQKVYGDSHIADARDDLEEHMDATEDRRSGIITIHVADRKPDRAAGIAREYVNQLNQVVTVLNTSAAHRERVFLEQRLAEVKVDLSSAEQKFSEFASKNTAVDIPAQGKATIEAAAMLEGQYISAQTELETLKQIYADGNVKVRAARARVEELGRQLDKLGGRYDASAPADGQAGQSVTYPSLKKLPVLGVTYADLYRNARIEELVFGTLTQQYESAKVQEAKETPTVKVLDPPLVPDKKSFPPRIQILFLGTCLSFAAVAAWIFGSEAWRNTDAADPRKMFASEVFSTVSARVGVLSRNGHAEHSSNGASVNANTGRNGDDRAGTR
ncbi:MAG: lipopolysaccharide biosynthesis protein [Acidobacteriia bacterium]|nr:lipopolysaccharide biosynthesis protein [Terriglobia bacterium]